MPRSKGRPTTRRNVKHTLASKSDPESNKALADSHWRRTVKSVLSWTIAIIGIPSAVLFFIPSVQVEAHASSNPRNPFTAFYTIQNIGYLAVYSVSSSCGIDYAIRPNGIGVINSFSDVGGARAGHLDASAKISTYCGLPFNATDYRELGIGIEVRYHLPLWPREKCTEFKFIGIRTAEGSYIWTPNNRVACS